MTEPGKMEVRVPDIGDFENVDVIEVHVTPGAVVAPEDPLITLETDKAAMDVPAPVAGTVTTVNVAAGDKVSEGSLILEIKTSGTPDHEDTADTVVAETATAGSKTSAAPSVRVVTVPELGDFSNVDVIEVLVSAGDTVAVEAPLVTLETDKAAMDVPSPYAGRVKQLLVRVGDTVSQGSEILEIETTADSEPVVTTPTEKSSPSVEETLEQPAPVIPQQAPPVAAPSKQLPPIDETSFGKAHAGPSVRKFARELGVDLGQVKGTGVKSRITQDDIKAFVKAILTGQAHAPATAALPSVPKVDFAKFGEIDVQPLTRIQKISGPRLHASWINLPHVFQFDQADVTELEQTRKKLKDKAAEKGIRLTSLAFVLKACVQALQEYPKFNASLSADGESLVYKKYFHLGFAADTPNGLVVPVIRDADKKDIYEIARDLGELSEKARDGKLKVDEMQGASFTVSSLGGIGGTGFTPIINAPEVAILGVSRSSMQAVYVDDDGDGDGQFVPRLMLPFCLSYDHRVIDGAAAVRFTTFLARSLSNIHGLLEAQP